MGFPGGSDGKNPPAMQETWGQSLVWEDPLEEGMQPTPVFLPGESPWAEKPGRLSPWGAQRVGQDLATKHRGRGDGHSVSAPATESGTHCDALRLG